MGKLNTDYLLSANGALKLLVIVLMVIVTIVSGLKQDFQISEDTNLDKMKVLTDVAKSVPYIRVIATLFLIVAIALFYIMLLGFHTRIPFFIYIDMILCFVGALFLVVNAILLAMYIQTASSIFSFLAFVAWGLSAAEVIVGNSMIKISNYNARPQPATQKSVPVEETLTEVP